MEEYSLFFIGYFIVRITLGYGDEYGAERRKNYSDTEEDEDK